MVIEKINLWNVSKINKHKTINVINYIENLQPLNSFTIDETKKFDRIIAEALAKDSAEAMLNTIGYRYNRQPKIYSKSQR